MTSTTAHRIAGRRLPGRGNHAATNVFWLSTVAIVCQPSILRNLDLAGRHEAEEQDDGGVAGWLWGPDLNCGRAPLTFEFVLNY